MPDPIVLTFAHPVDLAATMDIQIPALAWQPVAEGWRRTYHLADQAVQVTVAKHPANDRALCFELSAALADTGLPSAPELGAAAVSRVAAMLHAHFPR